LLMELYLWLFFFFLSYLLLSFSKNKYSLVQKCSLLHFLSSIKSSMFERTINTVHFVPHINWKIAAIFKSSHCCC
jgi:hypothetical protein